MTQLTHSHADDPHATLAPTAPVMAEGVDDEPVEGNRRLYQGWRMHGMAVLAILYSAFHLYVLNVSPMETWSYRIVHVCGALIAVIGRLLGWLVPVGWLVSRSVSP